MTSKLDIDRVIQAIHAVTGRWLSGADAESLMRRVGTREELLAHGIIDLKWLEHHPGAQRYFLALRHASALPGEPLLGSEGPPPPSVDAGPDRDHLLALVKQFAEGSTEADPLKTLAQIAASAGRKIKRPPVA